MSRGTHLILVEVPEQKLDRQREDLSGLFAQEDPPAEGALHFLLSPYMVALSSCRVLIQFPVDRTGTQSTVPG